MGKLRRLNTAFKPPEDVAEKAISLSKEIDGRAETFFVLDGIQFHPHITVYSPEYPESNLDNILKRVEGVANKSESIGFTVRGITVWQDFITLDLEVSPEIQKLHEEIVIKLNSWREGRIISEKYQRISYSPEQQENIKNTATPT